jgi:protein-glucosylgalactosylhydroxylysine glucosidase
MINRNNLVARHRIRLTQPDAGSPLSVDNHEFAFPADITGLQTLPAFHQQHMQLDTQAQWSWHAMRTRPATSWPIR